MALVVMIRQFRKCSLSRYHINCTSTSNDVVPFWWFKKYELLKAYNEHLDQSPVYPGGRQSEDVSRQQPGRHRGRFCQVSTEHKLHDVRYGIFILVW